MLATPSGSRGKDAAKWLAMEIHKEARELIDEWVKMKQAGETDWGISDLLRELQSSHGYPFKSHSSLSNLLRDRHQESSG